MKKRDKRKQEKADKQVKNARLGYCHGCGAPWTKLTYEHVPPRRVQALIPAEHLRFNPIDPAMESAKAKRNGASDKRLPPVTIAHGGLQVKAFGECCQQLTQSFYGQAFFDWSHIVLDVCKNVDVDEDRVQAVVEIEPLAVIKQIASIALAAGQFTMNSKLIMLRRFIQNPTQVGLPTGFDFYAYLNPIRPKYNHPQCRLWRNASVVRNFVTGEQAMVMAEVSVPPLGYVMLYNHHAACQINQHKVTVSLGVQWPVIRIRLNLLARCLEQCPHTLT